MDNVYATKFSTYKIDALKIIITAKNLYNYSFLIKWSRFLFKKKKKRINFVNYHSILNLCFYS